VPARQVYLTPEGLKQLQGELDHLKTAKRREVAKRIHDASQGGGTVDNAEYDEAKNEQAFTEGRIRELESLLSNAVVAKSGERKRARKKSVEFGSSITVKTASGDKKAYKLVGSAEAAPLEGKISNESPVGSALIGHLVGDTVEVETPSGVMELTITRIG
jgi:transcription elongation factor GreA